MNDKIAWYREVLALEPGSKVFIPLARLLVEAGQGVEAAGVLRRGLELHPEFLEARLLLVEVESGLGSSAGLDAEVLRIGQVLERYPTFWREWAAALSGQGGSGGNAPAALAALQLAASFQGRPVDWAEVIRKGLDTVLLGPGQPVRTEEPAASAPEPEPMAEPLAESDGTDASPDDFLLDAGGDETGGLDEDPAMSAQPAAPGDEASLRTRTMAEILAEQGDVDGALDIYRELLEGAPAGPERQELADRIEDLRVLGAGRAGLNDPAVRPGSPVPEPERSPVPKQKLVATLEALADRLEARTEG